MSNKPYQDDELKTALQRIYQNIEVPDSSKSWSIVQRRLNKRYRFKKRMQNLKISVFIVICSLILNSALMMTLPTAHSQISGLVKKVADNFIEFFHKETKDPSSDKAKTPPPPDESMESNGNSGSVLETSLEEARARAPFKLLVPTYIPKKFELDTVRIFYNAEEITNVHIKYANANGELISILQHQIEGESSHIKAVMAIGSGDYKDVLINGNQAILMIANKGNSILEWLTGEHVLIRISGNLTESELNKIATSFE